MTFHDLLWIYVIVFGHFCWQNCSLAFENDLMPLPIKFQQDELDSLMSFDYWTLGNAISTSKWDILHSNGMANMSTKLQLADGSTSGKTVVSSINASFFFSALGKRK